MTWGKTCTLLSVSLWWCHWNSFQLNEAAVSRENFKKVSWKAKKTRGWKDQEFPLQQGQSSEFKHWKGWLRGDLHDESLQRNLNRNIRSGLWTCRELDWYVGGVQMWDFKNCVCVRSRRSMDSSTSAWWQGGAQSCSSSDVHSRRTSKSHRVVLKCSPLQQK